MYRSRTTKRKTADRFWQPLFSLFNLSSQIINQMLAGDTHFYTITILLDLTYLLQPLSSSSATTTTTTAVTFRCFADDNSQQFFGNEGNSRKRKE